MASYSGVERSSSGEGERMSRDRDSESFSSDAAEDSDGEMMRAAAGPLPASSGIGWRGQVVRK